MPAKITNERMISIAKKLNIDIKDFARDKLLDVIMDSIESLSQGKNQKWKNDNSDIIKFYNDAVEEMEKALEYEGTFF